MVVMVGQTGKKSFVKTLKAEGWGRLWSRDRPNLYDGEPWGWDNNAYSWWVQGMEFHDVAFLQRLWRDYLVGVPYLAACPDLPARGEESLDFSMWWLARLPKAWPWYLVIQDGMTLEMIAPHISRFKGLFLGGTDAFKHKALEWCNFAHRNNKLFHYGRCGTLGKLAHAKRIGADSIDSATPLFEEERFHDFVKAVNGNSSHEQLTLTI